MSSFKVSLMVCYTCHRSPVDYCDSHGYNVSLMDYYNTTHMDYCDVGVMDYHNICFTHYCNIRLVDFFT